MAKKGVAVDFDGVLHSYTSGWHGAAIIADAPLPGAFEFITWAVEHYNVTIFTVRAKVPEGIGAIFDWLEAHGLAPEVMHKLVVTSEKPKAQIYIDDRGWRFTGTFPTREEIEAFRPWKVGDGQTG